MKNNGHKGGRRGKKVIVLMVDGKHIVAIYKDRTDRFVMFMDHKPIARSEIRAISDYKVSPRRREGGNS